MYYAATYFTNKKEDKQIISQFLLISNYTITSSLFIEYIARN